jgi:methylglyoxal synthase
VLAGIPESEMWSPQDADESLLARPGLALVAHDHKKLQLVDLAVCYRDVLAHYRLVATATTGKMLQRMVGLKVECLRSGSAGGDRQVADCVASGGVSAVIFLVDPFTRRPHEPGVEAVMRMCNMHDIPIATNVSTATALLNSVSLIELYAGGSRSSLEDK